MAGFFLSQQTVSSNSKIDAADTEMLAVLHFLAREMAPISALRETSGGAMQGLLDRVHFNHAVSRLQLLLTQKREATEELPAPQTRQ